jgi:N6-adenosine-specific RNA methylase IME4
LVRVPCELFSRERHEGWVCLGNEIDGQDIRDAIEEVKNRNAPG